MTAAVWACGEEKSRRETEARQLRPAATEGQGTDAPADPAPQVLVLERTNSSPKYRTLTAPCAPGGTEATPGRISSEPGPPDRRVARGRDFFNATSPGAKTRSWRGAGRGRAPTRSFHARGQLPHKVGFVSAPVPSPPGNSSAAPRRGKGAGGSAKARPVPSRARLSGRRAGTRRRAAPAEPSRGAGPAAGPGAQRGRLGRRAGARLRSPSGGLRPRGRSLGVAAAWAVARPGRAKDAPRRSARAPAAPAEEEEEEGPPDGEGSRLAQPQPEDGAAGE